jgi:hypothetical protein
VEQYRFFAIGYSVESALLIHSAPFVIPEQVAYTTRTITVPSTLSSVADIFNVSLTHSYLSDVEMEVISAQGTTVKII